jgi:hypothetical protein
MPETCGSNGDSAEVALSLVIGDRTIDLSQVGPHFVVLKAPIELPPSPAEVHVNVDGNIHRRRVFLVNGIHPAIMRTPIESHAAE